MTEDVLIFSGIISIIVIVLFYLKLASINKEIKKTNYLLYKMHLKNGGELTPEDTRYLNK